MILESSNLLSSFDKFARTLLIKGIGKHEGHGFDRRELTLLGCEKKEMQITLLIRIYQHEQSIDGKTTRIVQVIRI